MLLKGLKVVEFASYIAAPGAAGILGDWGAEVIKVERPGGDSMRHVFGDAKSDLAGNPTFDMDNRGKRAVVLDISKPEGRDALAKLASTADIFITNVRPASLKKQGLDEATLRAANPRLIYTVVTGYGLDGPDAAKPASARDFARKLSVYQIDHPGATTFNPWDNAWLSQQVQKRDFAYDRQEARQYFAYDKVRDGILQLTQDLFGVTMSPASVHAAIAQAHAVVTPVVQALSESLLQAPALTPAV